MKRIRILSSPVVLALLMVFAASRIAAEQAWRKDDRVLAEWANSAWYPGKIASPCDGGFTVLYDDGDTKCVPLTGIVADEAPAAGDIEVGTLVLAQWGSAFYPAKVTGIDGSEYGVGYFDGDTGTLELGQLRLLTGRIAELNDFTAGTSSTSGSPAASAGAELIIAEDIEIWRGGSKWATIETDGDIWRGGTKVGQFESDGDIWIGGNNEGEVEPDGDIWFGSDSVGEIESNGNLWRGSSRIAAIEADGTIYLGGSWWGEADPFGGAPEEMRIVAAVLAFFAEEFGFYQ